MPLLIYALCLLEGLSGDSRFLTPSLFRGIAPYIRFVEPSPSPNSSTDVHIPFAIQKHLLWPSSASKYPPLKADLVHGTQVASGHILLPKSSSSCRELSRQPILGRFFRIPLFCRPGLWHTLPPHQKVNYSPATPFFGNKDKLLVHLRKAATRLGRHEFPFLLPAYILPQELGELKAVMGGSKEFWIIKPETGAYSKGISVLHDPGQLSSLPADETLVAQQYVRDPYLYTGLKVELRTYVLLTSHHPVRLHAFPKSYHFKLGLANYSDGVEGLSDRCIHMRELSLSCPRPNTFDMDDAGIFERILKEGKFGSLEEFLSGIHESIRRIFMSAERSLARSFYEEVRNRYNSYQLFSVDFMLDSNLAHYLTEVNVYPEFDLQGNKHRVHRGLVAEALNLAGYNFPPTMSGLAIKMLRESLAGLMGSDRGGTPLFQRLLYSKHLTGADKEKQAQFETADRDFYLGHILSNLTIDDLRQIVLAEDELHRSTVSTRLLPSPHISKYIPHIESEKYYYKLLDAWETRFSEDREGGRELIQKYMVTLSWDAHKL